MWEILCISEKMVNKNKEEIITAKKAVKPYQTITQYYLNEILQLPGFTIKRIAENIQISTTEVSRLHKGHIKNPRPKTFRKLLALYYGLINPIN